MRICFWFFYFLRARESMMITHPIPMVTECLVLTHNMHHQLEIPLLFFFFFSSFVFAFFVLIYSK